MTIGGTSQACCCSGMVTVSTEVGGSAIRALGGITICLSGQIRIGDWRVSMCAAITISEPDFTVAFNQ